jgi:hypothetical protein
VRPTLEPNGHPLTEEEMRHLNYKATIKAQAAIEFLKGTKDRKDVVNSYPYPDD